MPTSTPARWSCLAAVFLGTAPAAFGQPYSWNPSMDTTGPQGGAGVWTASGTTWWDGTTGTNTTLPPTETAVFGGTVGGVQVLGDVSAGALQFNTTGYALFPNLGGGRINLTGSTPFLQLGTGTTAVTADVGVELAGSGTLRAQGPGVLNLTAAVTYTGTLDTGTGTVQVQASTPAALAVTVGNGVLGGGGTVNGTVNVSGKGTLSPGGIGAGATVDTLTVGASTWGSGGSFRVEVQDADAAAGSGYDRVVGTTGSALQFSAPSGILPFTVELASLTPGGSAGPTPGPARDFDNTQTYTWTVATFDGGISGFSTANIALDSSGFQNDLGGGAFSLFQSGNDLVIQFTPVPEPAAGLAVAGAVLGLARVARRRGR